MATFILPVHYALNHNRPSESLCGAKPQELVKGGAMMGLRFSSHIPDVTCYPCLLGDVNGMRCQECDSLIEIPTPYTIQINLPNAKVKTFLFCNFPCLHDWVDEFDWVYDQRLSSPL